MSEFNGGGGQAFWGWFQALSPCSPGQRGNLWTMSLLLHYGNSPTKHSQTWHVM